MRPVRSGAGGALSDVAPLGWHARFLAHTTARGQVVLIEDGDAVLFEAGATERVAQAVSGGACVGEILALEHAPTEQDALRAALDELLAHDLLQTVDAHRRAAQDYVRPTFTAAAQVLGSAGREVVLFAAVSATEPVVNRALAVAAACRVAVAVVDDELDPRLGEFDRLRRAEGAPWLMWRPRGRRPSLGPWFRVDSGPCWSCLRGRLLGNQPVRRWLMEQAGVPALAVPIAGELLASEQLAALSEQLEPGTLLQLEPRSARVLGAHYVAGSEHCPSCGETLRQAARRSRPLRLQPSARQPDADGGYRSCSAGDTLTRLSRHVSRLTGVVADVSLLPASSPEHVPIYRSALLACPLAKPLVRPADFYRVTLGKGKSAAQSRASALGEALERSLAQYRGDEPTVLAAAQALAGKRVLPPPSLRQLSARQLTTLALTPWQAAEPIHWIDVDSLTHREVGKAPLTFCYANTPFEREEQLCRYDSNGCAAGRTVEEALLQGLLEVIERDAAAIWWYNRLVMPSLPRSLVHPSLGDALERWLGPGCPWWLLDLTHDLGTPVCVAVARRSDAQLRFGFGCHLEVGLAAERAVTELCQLVAIGEHRATAFDFASVADEPWLHPAADPKRPGSALGASTAYDDIRDALLACVARLRACGLEVLLHRYPAIDASLAVVKVIVPGACHIWPQLGAPRLYQVPVALGWAPRRLAEHELNPLGLFV